MATRRNFKKNSFSDINMIPFIDVMLVLLVIFMVTAPLLSPSIIDLPSVGSSAKKQPDDIVQIIIKDENNITVKSASTTKQTVIETLAADAAQFFSSTESASAGDKAIVISADKEVSYGTVIKVMDILKQANFTRVGLAVKANN